MKAMMLHEKKKMMIKLAPTVTNQRMKTTLIRKATISIILEVKRSNYISVRKCFNTINDDSNSSLINAFDVMKKANVKTNHHHLNHFCIDNDHDHHHHETSKQKKKKNSKQHSIMIMI